MNLNSVVSGVVSAVNRRVLLSLQRSTGWTSGANAKRTPTYDPPLQVWGQEQALSFSDLRQIDGLNINGTRRAIYLDGDWNGLVRSENKGGDLVTTPDGRVWLVVHVLEHWRGWTKVVVTLQDGA